MAAKPDSGWEQPALVPARMVNEYSYCPRLFFLEWVQGRFADNDDTVEGRWVHRVVDRAPSGDPDPSEEEPSVAKSLTLSSEALGLICKVDLVEFDGKAAVPIDYKRGKAPENPDRSWEPERVQVCIQGLLLREAGFVCDSGVLYFAGSRTRVEVPFDDELIVRTLELVAELREVAAADQAPVPLDDSPKCPRCSLVGLCLPDETNLLAGRTQRAARRLLPSDGNGRPLYVSEPGARVGRSKGRIEVVKDGERLASVRPVDVSQICVFGNVQLSTQLINAMLREGTPVCWFSHGGWFNGMATQPAGTHVELRMRQVARASTGRADIAREVVRAKIANSRILLLRNARDRPEGAIGSLSSLAASAAEAESTESLLGIEGAAARLYFGSFAKMLRNVDTLPGSPFAFEGRNRRPPMDAINCLLSFCYSLLVKDVSATLHTVGLDPYIGFYHRPRFGRPALALDLCEEFRPLVADSIVIRLVNNGEVSSSSFVDRAGAVALTDSGRRAVLAAHERRLAQEITHPIFDYTVSYRRIFEVQARLLAANLLGEIDTYTGFTTR
jgi:CRISP-associated protein Cas1